MKRAFRFQVMASHMREQIEDAVLIFDRSMTEAREAAAGEPAPRLEAASLLSGAPAL